MKIQKTIACLLCLMASPLASYADPVINGIGNPNDQANNTSEAPLVALQAGALNIINFDDVVAPDRFSSAVALRSVGGVQFNSSSRKPLDGGAVLNELSGFGVTGHSSPNFLAFNCSSKSTMNGGGLPKLPEVIRFPTEVSGVSLKIGDPIFFEKVRISGIGSLGIENKVVTLTPDLQLVRFRKPLTHIAITSAKPCLFIIDDISWK